MGQNEAGQRAEIERWLSANGIDVRAVRWFVGRKLGVVALEWVKAAIFAGDVGTVVLANGSASAPLGCGYLPPSRSIRTQTSDRPSDLSSWYRKRSAPSQVTAPS